MRACCTLILLSAAAGGLAAKARPDSPSAGLRQLPALYGKNRGASLLPATENKGLTRAVLSCRGGSVTATATAAAGGAAVGEGATACRGNGGVGRGVLPAVADKDTRGRAKRGWGQLRRSPEARTSSSSTELLGPRGGANADASADLSKAAYKTALLRTGLLVCSAGAFGLGTWVVKGKTSALEFFAGYIVEQSLSVDNLFIFIMLFDYFKVPAEFQSRVLNWGIIGAVSMRAIMIVVGVAAIQRFRAVMLVFAGILVVSSIKLLMEGTEEDHADSSALEGNMVLRIANWMMDSTDYYDGEKFFTLVKGAKKATPLLLCLICIEMTDFVFAVDSIPAVLAISQDTFIVYASNVFAICAMRSIYTLVSHAISDLPYLKPAVALVLGFVGGKMFAEFFHYEINVGPSLAVVCGILGIGSIASVISNKRRDAALAASSVSGGGSSGLTFESISAATGDEGGQGEDSPVAAAAAAAAAAADATADDAPAVAASTDGEDITTPSLEDGKSVVAGGLAGLKTRGDAAATASADAAEAAGHAVADAPDAAAEVADAATEVADAAAEVANAAAEAVDAAVEDGESGVQAAKEAGAGLAEGAASAVEGLTQQVVDGVEEVLDAAASIAGDVEEGLAEISEGLVADDVVPADGEGGGANTAPERNEDV